VSSEKGDLNEVLWGTIISRGSYGKEKRRNRQVKEIAFHCLRGYPRILRTDREKASKWKPKKSYN